MPRGKYIRTERTRINIGLSKKGQKAWNKDLKGVQVAWNKGIPHTEETKLKISKTKKAKHRKMTDDEKKKLSDYNKSINRKPPVRFGKDNNQWKGGKSFEVYPVDWTQTLKRSIRERDRYQCQVCGKNQEDEALSIHHIDYNKENCNPVNLISLCRSCHRKTNDNREYWIEYFKQLCFQKLPPLEK